MQSPINGTLDPGDSTASDLISLCTASIIRVGIGLKSIIRVGIALNCTGKPLKRPEISLHFYSFHNSK